MVINHSGNFRRCSEAAGGGLARRLGGGATIVAEVEEVGSKVGRVQHPMS